jgi:hypothetical protein
MGGIAELEQWKIQKNRERCEKPGCPLAAATEFYAVLQLPECVRVERCANCFEELRHEAAELPFHWRVRRTLDGKTKPMLDLDSLRVLFDRLGQEPETPAEPENVDGTEDGSEEKDGKMTGGLRYLVALLLLRKRRLKMVDPQNEEQERADLLVVDPKVEDMVPVALSAPDLDPDRLGNLREELMVAIGEEPETQSASADNES